MPERSGLKVKGGAAYVALAKKHKGWWARPSKEKVSYIKSDLNRHYEEDEVEGVETENEEQQQNETLEDPFSLIQSKAHVPNCPHGTYNM